MARKFFGDAEPVGLAASAYNVPRPIVGSTEKLNLTKGAERIDKRPTSAWQTAAWQCFDAIGEVHFAFSMIGQIMSRVRLYPAIVEYRDQPPMHIADYLESLKERTGETAPVTRKVCETAAELVDDLTLNADGGLSNMMRLMALNLCVPGEMYFSQIKDKWTIASTDELQQSGDTLRYRKSRTAKSSTAGGAEGEKLPKDAFVARIWRPHPRWTGEPDSSMLGTLDDCELLVLLQQAMRSTTRSRMNAGIMFLPEGITSFVSGDDGMSVEEALTRASLDSVQDETAQATVVPQILKGPPDLGEKIRWIPYGRQIDQQFIDLLDKTLQRVLQGLDIPKEIVAGLSDAKFANAIVITDSLFKAHVEPLVLLVIDSLTTVYLRPLLIRQLGLSAEQIAQDPFNIINRLVVWADTSNISTRPDKSQAANEGYDRHALSASAWRDTRGFADTDKPDAKELLLRLVLEKGQPPPDMVEAIIKAIDPNFFEAARAENAEIPPEIENLLQPGALEALESGEIPPAPAPAGQSGMPAERQAAGEEVNPNGSLPPRQVPTPVG